jgi:hypothetical protein
MKIYTVCADVNKYCGLYYRGPGDLLEFDRRFNGTPMKDRWTGNHKFEFRSKPSPSLRGDFPGLSTHIPIFNLKAVKALADLLKGNGELLPMTCEGEDHFLFNVTRVVDALDEAHCQIKRFDSGKIMYIIRYSFLRDRLVGETVFKIPQIPLMDVFVTEDFVKRVKTSKLKGFEFRRLWSDESPHLHIV